MPKSKEQLTLLYLRECQSNPIRYHHIVLSQLKAPAKWTDIDLQAFEILLVTTQTRA